MRRSVAIFAVLGVFLVGVAVGIVSTHLFYARSFRHPGAPPFLAGDVFVEHLERQLDLTAEQKAEVERILEKSRREGEVLREEMRPRLEGIFERSSAEIEKILTAEQLKEFEQVRHLQRRRMGRFIQGRPGRRPPPDPSPADQRDCVRDRP